MTGDGKLPAIGSREDWSPSSLDRRSSVAVISRSFDLARRVVVTGLGLITPVGNSVEATWSALMDGRNGVGYIKKFDTEKFSVKIAAEVNDFDPLKFIAKKEARKMGAFIHYAIAAATEAMADSGFELTEKGSFRRACRKRRHLHQQRHRRFLGHRARTLETSERRT